MSFLQPAFLWSLPALALLPLAWLWLLRRRQKPVLRYSHLAPVRRAMRHSWRRHVPPVLILVACSLLLFAAARPVAALTLPWAKAQILLAMDVSLSMRVADVEPTRLAAAQAAAKAFLAEVPREVEVGLVTFAGTAQVVRPATTDRASLVEAIDAFQMQYGTAIGSAIVLCLAELFPEHGIDLGEMTFGSKSSPPARNAMAGAGRPAAAPPAPVPPGSYDAAAIVLLSDGRRTMGIDTLEAAKMAADRGVRIYVVGLGTVDGTATMPEGMAIYLKLDEPTLREVARMTGGEYQHAGTAEALRVVYQNLGSRLVVGKRHTELAPLLALLGALLLAAATGLSLAWFGPPR